MKHALLFLLSIALSACGTDITVQKPIPYKLITNSENGGYNKIIIQTGKTKASNTFVALLTKNLQQHLLELSLYPNKKALLKVKIQVVNYNIKDGVSRQVMGVLAGADEVKSKVLVINTNTNQIVGESMIFTSSSMAYGNAGMAWIHADDIAMFLSTSN